MNLKFHLLIGFFVCGIFGNVINAEIAPRPAVTFSSLLGTDSLNLPELDQQIFASTLSAKPSASAFDDLKLLLDDPKFLDKFLTKYREEYASDINLRGHNSLFAVNKLNTLAGNSRTGIFKENILKIAEHNLKAESGLVSWSESVNSFTYLTKDEFRSVFLSGVTDLKRENLTSLTPLTLPEVSADSSRDWRNNGIVTPVKNQGGCGSCYAFGALGTLESALAKQYGTNQIYDLSEQEIVDCSNNHGCNGGNPTIVFNYIKNSGIAQETTYRYTARQGGCQGRGQSNRLKLHLDWATVSPRGNEDALAAAIDKYGPVSVLVAADNWNHYRSGVFNNCASNINHAVVAVGYTPEYFIIKNSWGQEWGESGYMRLKRGSNACCVADYADAITWARF